MRPRILVPQKRGITPKGAKYVPILVSHVLLVEISKNHVHGPSLKRNGWKLLHLWPTAHFGTQNFPIPTGQVRDRVWKFAHCHILYIIMQQKPAKFQVYWSTVSIVVRPRNFGAPKRVITTQKGPKYVSHVLPVEISKNHVHRPNLKRIGWKFLHLWPTAHFGTQNCPIPTGQVRDRVWKFAHCHILYIIMQQKPAKFQVYWSTVSIVVRPRNFGAPKRVITTKGAQICSQIFVSCFAGGDI